jgi:hypothetical protein
MFFNFISMCTICLENFKSSDHIILFACKSHIYHKPCIKEWIKKNNVCPVCKYDLMDDIVIDNR